MKSTPPTALSIHPTRRQALRFGAGFLAGSLLSTRLSAAEEVELRGAERDEVKITSVQTFRLRHQLKRPFGVSVSVPLSTTREALLVKIETNEGLVGWGETAPISGTRGTIDDHLAPRLIGRNPLEYRSLWRSLWGPNFGNGLAVGAVETAINDIRGKVLGLPVAELFGGRLRDRVPVYASAMNYLEGSDPSDQYPREAAGLIDQGYNALKMRLGRYSVGREAKVAEMVREVVGPDVKLMVDGNAAYTFGAALKMGHVLAELDFEFFEEPMPQSPNYAGYDRLREKLPLPLAGGEALDSRGTAKALLDRRAFDIIQPDVALCGGLGEALFIAEMAALSGVRCVPHCWGGDISIAASTHLLSLLPDPHWGLPTDTPLLEVDQSENPWRNGLATTPLKVHDGFINVPKMPGLGIEVDEEVVRRYAV